MIRLLLLVCYLTLAFKTIATAQTPANDAAMHLGQVIHSKVEYLSNSQEVIQLPVANLMSGLYWVRVTTGEQRQVLRLVKN